MDNKTAMPMWVMLAFSNIRTRKGALLLILFSVIFTLYCLPWSVLVPEPAWLAKIFLIDDWSWVAMMVPVVIWYWLCLRWMDKNSAWEQPAS